MPSYLFEEHEHGEELHLFANPKIFQREGTILTRIGDAVRSIGDGLLFAFRNAWFGVLIFALISEQAKLSEIMVMLCMTLAARWALDRWMRPDLVPVFGRACRYIFSRKSLTIEALLAPNGAKTRYSISYADLLVMYSDSGSSHGGSVSFRVVSKETTHPFNEWLRTNGLIYAISCGDVTEIGRRVRPWLKEVQEVYSSDWIKDEIQLPPALKVPAQPEIRLVAPNAPPERPLPSRIGKMRKSGKHR